MRKIQKKKRSKQRQKKRKNKEIRKKKGRHRKLFFLSIRIRTFDVSMWLTQCSNQSFQLFCGYFVSLNVSLFLTFLCIIFCFFFSKKSQNIISIFSILYSRLFYSFCFNFPLVVFPIFIVCFFLIFILRSLVAYLLVASPVVPAAALRIRGTSPDRAKMQKSANSTFRFSTTDRPFVQNI